MDQAKLPQHIAIIQDGNRRWSKLHNLLPWDGHKKGISTFKLITREVFKKNIPYLTFWALSIDNLKKRSPEEIKFLLLYIRQELDSPELINEFVDSGIRVHVIGKWRELIEDAGLKNALQTLEKSTEACSKFHLTILFAYDGKTEMLDAISKIQTQAIDENSLKKALWTSYLPPVDLLIRTGGEPHLSAGFMMWLITDSQLYFTDTKWPEFNSADLNLVLKDYCSRKRRFGC